MQQTSNITKSTLKKKHITFPLRLKRVLMNKPDIQVAVVCGRPAWRNFDKIIEFPLPVACIAKKRKVVVSENKSIAKKLF